MKFPVWLIFFTAFLLAMTGCGGGGGGTGGSGSGSSAAIQWRDGGCTISSGTASMIYRALWPSSAPASASVVIQVLGPTGTVIRTEVANRTTTSQITVSNLPAGVFEIRGQLYTAANGTGSLMGTFRKIADLCSSANAIIESSSTNPAAALTAEDRSPSRLAVFPASVSILSNQTIRFVGQLLDANARPIFAASSPAWTASGPGTIAAGGLLTPSSGGAIEVTAAQSGLSGTGQATVTAFNPTSSKWTILVYINAANDLYSASTLNMNQMERVANNPNVRFVVQWKQSKSAFSGSSFDGTRRYLVTPDNTNQVVSALLQDDMRNSGGQQIDMGSPQTLRDFVQWGKTNFPSERTALVIWNHGNGWRRSPDSLPTRAFSYDDQYGTSIQTWQINTALSGFSFDIVAWDCSLMQMAEVAHEFRGIAAYMAGSEESPPAEGYPYDAVFAGFAANPSASTRDLAKGFVDGMLNNPPYANRKITQSVIELSKMNDLAASMDAFAAAMIAEGTSLHEVIRTARTGAQSYSPTALRWYRDIKHFCTLIEGQASTPAAVKTASADVRAKLAAALVWEGHNAQSPNSGGLSIDLSPASVYSGMSTDYQRLALAKETRWDSFLASSPD